MDFLHEWSAFWRLFYTNGGWHRGVEEGLVNTLKIAVLGLLIGIVIGTLIAAIKVLPKYKRLPRVLSAICNDSLWKT